MHLDVLEFINCVQEPISVHLIELSHMVLYHVHLTITINFNNHYLHS